MQCDACRREAVVFQPYSGKNLCTLHFVRDFEAKAKRTIRTRSWLQPNDHIAVAFSGDASSVALLSFLSKLTSQRRDIHLSAVIVDTGTGNFTAIETIGEIATSLGVEWFSASFKGTYGFTWEEIEDEFKPANACRLFTVLVNELSMNTAYDHGATRYAVSTTVDDIAADFFSGLLAGSSITHLCSFGFPDLHKIPVIMPFMDIQRSEVIQYGELQACNRSPLGQVTPCNPVSHDVLEALENYNSRHPATKFALANLVNTLTKTARKNNCCRIPLCTVCGEPLDNGVCWTCTIRKKIAWKKRS